MCKEIWTEAFNELLEEGFDEEEAQRLVEKRAIEESAKWWEHWFESIKRR